MTKLWLVYVLLWCAPAIGCVDDPPAVGEIASEVSKISLQGDGFQCQALDPLEDHWGCSKCSSVTTTDVGGSHTSKVCTNYLCYADGECFYTGTTVADATFAADLNFWFEPENGALLGGIRRIGNAEGASAGTYLDLTGGGVSTQSFTSPVAATVYGWARVLAPSAAANSAWFQLDNGALRRVELPVSTTWQWVRLADLTGATTTWAVGVGNHTLRVYGDEAGVKVDRVLLTASPQFIPVAETVEAETASLVAPMRLGSILTTSGSMTRYLWAPSGASGLAQLSIGLPSPGLYAVWGRVQAPTAAASSFSIGLVGESRTVWEAPVASGWAWDRVDVAGVPTLFSLRGSDVLELAQRGTGIKLDKLVLTNDPGFKLVEPLPPIKPAARRAGSGSMSRRRR